MYLIICIMLLLPLGMSAEEPDWSNPDSFTPENVKAFPEQAIAADLDKAITEYERLIHADPFKRSCLLVHPKYHYRLAKLYQEKGETEKAIKEYETFLDIWKDADEDLPELIDARERYAKLKEGL